MNSCELYGSCHCGNVKYRAKIDKPLKSNETEKCNCSICFKLRLWYIKVDENNLEIKGDCETYQYGKKEKTYYSCSKCHVIIYGFHKPINPNTKSFNIVSIPTIDGLTPNDLRLLNVKYIDGLNDKLGFPSFHRYL